MNVSSIMTRKPQTCRPNETLDRATRIMWDYDCGVVPVQRRNER